MGTTSVRRNLFHHHLSRRPVSAAPTDPPVQSNVTSGIHSMSTHILPSTQSVSTPSLSTGAVDSGEIVSRDKNGAYKLDIPVLPSLAAEEDGDETEGVEDGGAPRGSATTGADSTAQTEISSREKEKIEASLVEMMCRNRNRQMSSEPAEILNLIHQSLQNKVATLDDDNWMYEPESNSRM
ncbi:hypothetical protein FE257_002583 [Aspergillus nanangensis]|uniref:Uncharacterized protein n=1 Tax=Aspergillus nanangensis TaxID=2582783 RepID=A0AAD4CTG2_ASPNN|nr:hypothetical protein FE257_002583 [Aspergillus nanangensis]